MTTIPNAVDPFGLDGQADFARIHQKNRQFFTEVAADRLVTCVETAFRHLLHTRSGPYTLQEMRIEKQNICGLFHSLIVTEIVGQLPGWREGRQGVEPDIVHDSGLTLQVKTRSTPDGIAGNRYTNQNHYADPSEYYLCVNFLPHDSICKIRAGWVEADWWKPQTGNGNASTLKKEWLETLPLLEGTYLEDLNLAAVPGIGEKTLAALHEQQIYRLKDLHNPETFEQANRLFRRETRTHIQELLDLSSTYIAATPAPVSNSFTDDLLLSLGNTVTRLEEEQIDVYAFFRTLSTLPKEELQRLSEKIPH